MKRYFFDYVSNDNTLADYEGRQFRTLRGAREHAKLLAIHLQYDLEAAYSGWSVIVRDVLGTKIHTVLFPARESCGGVIFKAANDLRLLKRVPTVGSHAYDGAIAVRESGVRVGAGT